MKINVVLVRHGETYANRSGTLQGHLDYKLNENGHSQASKAGEWLVTEPFDDAYSSDLSRAFDTASHIVRRNKSFSNINEIRQWSILRERTFGVMEGRSINEFRQDAARCGFKNAHSLWHHTPEGGESLEDLRERAAAFFDLFCEDLANNWEHGDEPTILLVTHGVIIKELMIHLAEDRGCDFPAHKGHAYRDVCPNSGITRLHLHFDSNKSLERVACSTLYCVNHLEGMEALVVQNIK